MDWLMQCGPASVCIVFNALNYFSGSWLVEIEEVGKITIQPEANAAIQITSIAWLNERLNVRQRLIFIISPSNRYNYIHKDFILAYLYEQWLNRILASVHLDSTALQIN
ncbi:MAG: hypothetical protein VX729_15165 [Pseudomonadota bacterium]|nr:hypothetical protein [Pseudomonadota bacterium]